MNENSIEVSTSVSANPSPLLIPHHVSIRNGSSPRMPMREDSLAIFERFGEYAHQLGMNYQCYGRPRNWLRVVISVTRWYEVRHWRHWLTFFSQYSLCSEYKAIPPDYVAFLNDKAQVAHSTKYGKRLHVTAKILDTFTLDQLQAFLSKWHHDCLELPFVAYGGESLPLVESRNDRLMDESQSGTSC